MGNQIVIPSMGNWYVEPLKRCGIIVNNVIESGTFFITLDCYSLKDPNQQLIVKAYESNEALEESNIARSCEVYFQQLDDLSKTVSIFGISNYTKIFLQNNLVFFCRKKHQFTLSQRLEEYPPLENVEKRWISYRILTLISSLHQITKSMIHGAINPDNVFVTWDLNVSIGDMAPFKPTYIKYNRPDLFHHFFTTASRGACYLAPEQLIISDSETDNVIFMFGSFSMDFFAAGLVIYYLYTGEHLLSFSQLAEISLALKKSKSQTDETKNEKNSNSPNSTNSSSDKDYDQIFNKYIYEKIKNLPNDIFDLVRILLDLDPSKRLSEQSVIDNSTNAENSFSVNSYDDIISPFFPSIFKQISDQLNEFFQKDMKLEHMIKLIPTFQMIIDDSDERQKKENPNDTFTVAKITVSKRLKTISGIDSKLILANVLTNSINLSKKVQEKSFFMNFICDYTLSLSENVKVSRILPIFCDILSSPSNFLRSNALLCILKLVTSLNMIPDGYECIFSSYLIKQIKMSYKGSSVQYRCSLAFICPKLAVEIARLSPESSALAVEMVNFILNEDQDLVIGSFVQSMRSITQLNDGENAPKSFFYDEFDDLKNCNKNTNNENKNHYENINLNENTENNQIENPIDISNSDQNSNKNTDFDLNENLNENVALENSDVNQNDNNDSNANVSLDENVDVKQTLEKTEDLDENQTLENNENLDENQTLESKENLDENQTLESKENLDENQTLESKENLDENQTLESKENSNQDQTLENKENLDENQTLENKENLDENQTLENKENLDENQTLENKENSNHDQTLENKENLDENTALENKENLDENTALENKENSNQDQVLENNKNLDENQELENNENTNYVHTLDPNQPNEDTTLPPLIPPVPITTAKSPTTSSATQRKLNEVNTSLFSDYHPSKCSFDLFVKFSHILLSCLNSPHTTFKLSVLSVLRDFFDNSPLSERTRFRKQYNDMSPLILGYFNSEIQVAMRFQSRNSFNEILNDNGDENETPISGSGISILNHNNDEMIEGYLEFFYWFVQRKLLDVVNMPELFLKISDFRRSDNVSIRFFASKIASALPAGLDTMRDTIFIMDIIYQRRPRFSHLSSTSSGSTSSKRPSFVSKGEIASITTSKPRKKRKKSDDENSLNFDTRKNYVKNTPLLVKAGFKIIPRFIKSSRVSTNPISIIAPHFNSKLKAVVMDQEGSLFYVASTSNPRDPKNLAIEPIPSFFGKYGKMAAITELKRTSLTLFVEEETGKVKMIDWSKGTVYDQYSYTFQSKPIKIISKHSNISYVLTQSNELSIYDCRDRQLSQTIQFDVKNLTASALCGWPQNCATLAVGFDEGLVQIVDTRMMMPISSILTDSVKSISPCFRNYCNFVVSSNESVEVFDAFLGCSELSLGIQGASASPYDGNVILTSDSGVFYLDCEHFENSAALSDFGVVQNLGIGDREEIDVERDLYGRASLHKHTEKISAVDHSKELFMTGDVCGMLNFWTLSKF